MLSMEISSWVPLGRYSNGDSLSLASKVCFRLKTLPGWPAFKRRTAMHMVLKSVSTEDLRNAPRWGLFREFNTYTDSRPMNRPSLRKIALK